MSVSTMTNLTNPAIDHFLAEYTRVKNNLSGNDVTWLDQLRQQALEQFVRHGFPTLQHEDWKYTDVTALTKRAFKWSAPTKEIVDLKSIVFEKLPCHRLVFINGHYSAAYSQLFDLPKDVQLKSLAEMITSQPEILEPYLGRLAVPNQAFIALNNVFFHDGVYLHLAPNTVLQHPIHIVHLSTTQPEPHFTAPRNLIIAEKNSEAVIIESFISTATNEHFSNSISEIFMGENCKIDHYKLLEEQPTAFHIDTLQVQQQTQSSFNDYAFTLNGGFVRTDTNITLAEEHAACTLNGLYLGRGKQHIDHHTFVDHAKPHGTSHENYKGVLADRSRAVFNGKVMVRVGAYKTNAEQSNKNLLLSKDAEIDTKPQLEIYNDDVRCTHGAAVGQLDDDFMFYLRSRGLSESNARGILIYAFVREILEKVPLKPLREHLEATIKQMTRYD